LIAKLLAHDEERRREFSKWGWTHCAPKYNAGIERRRLLIINSVFLAAAHLGCRPSMSTSRYAQDVGSERQLRITVGNSDIGFTVESVKSKKSERGDRLRLALDPAQERANAANQWEDTDESPLEKQITDVLVEMLVSAEAKYREGVVGHREWIIERKRQAEAERKRRQEEAERRAREVRERLARERIGQLLSQARALDRAKQIRAYVETVLSRNAEMPIAPSNLANWVAWARQEADRIDPVKNGTVEQAIKEHST
jgi:hypothetical protein